MGKPAARMGDPTTHGGSIVAGCPTVLIGGMPAARLGDAHVCPLANPAPTPVPHVGMPVTLGSAGVFIGGMPAARMGDMAPCTGPPDSIVGGCPTVLIGEVGGGAAGAGAGGAGAGDAAAGAAASAAMAEIESSDDDQEDDQDPTHWLDVEFVDKKGLPIGGVGYELTGPDGTTAQGMLSRAIKRGGIEEGTYRIQLRAITDVRWSAQEAEVGDKVDLIVETAGIEDGTGAELAVYIRDANYTDHLLEKFDAEVSGDQVRVPWTLEVDEKLLEICDKKEQNKRYSQPFFFYRVTIGSLAEQSGLLRYKDWIEIELKDDEGNPIGNREYAIYLPTGEVRTGKLDGSGKARIENVPPGGFEVAYDLTPDE
jgi:uncharacterized Zn-binding protein involved in type VI secretion